MAVRLGMEQRQKRKKRLSLTVILLFLTLAVGIFQWQVFVALKKKPSWQGHDEDINLIKQNARAPTGSSKVNSVKVPRLCRQKESNPLSWVTFMGDSNMRHTYYWWTQALVKPIANSEAHGFTYGLDRTNLGFGGRWADQEIIIKLNSRNRTTVPTGGYHPQSFQHSKSNTAGEISQPMVRYSFRFLHGSVTEFVDDTRNWHIPRVASKDDPNVTEIEEQAQSNKILPDDREDDELWKGRIRPSDYAIWATQHRKPIEDDSRMFRNWMQEWNSSYQSAPDVVILTQGWGGVPRATELAIVLEVIEQNPDTLFVWAPMYVTDHQVERYEGYAEAGILGDSLSVRITSQPNLKMVDLWDLAQRLPNSKSLYHAPVGGAHMKESMRRIWAEVVSCLR